MPKNTNSASRLHSLLAKANGLVDNISTLDAWGQVFQITDAKQSSKALRVAEQVQLMYEELQRVRRQMQERSISEGLYVPYLSRVEEALNIYALNTPWSNYKGNLQPDTMLALLYCAESLPHEEDQVDASEFTQLLADIEALEESLKSSNLPESLKELIRRQLDRIRSAVSKYKIVGARAIRDASRAAIVEVIESQDQIRPHRQTEEVSTFGRIINQAGAMADRVIKTEKVIESVTKIAAYLENLFK